MGLGLTEIDDVLRLFQKVLPMLLMAADASCGQTALVICIIPAAGLCA